MRLSPLTSPLAGRYRVIRELGGGMATVYPADDLKHLGMVENRTNELAAFCEDETGLNIPTGLNSWTGLQE